MPSRQHTACASSTPFSPSSDPHASSDTSSCRTTSSSLSYLRPEVRPVYDRLQRFVREECVPAEREYEDHMRSRRGRDRWTADAVPPCLPRLQRRARSLGLWNLFLSSRRSIEKIPRDRLTPDELRYVVPPVPLTHREYGILSECMGQCPVLAPQACNCSAPDTGNMEVLLEFGTSRQQSKYLVPLLKGEIRSTFLMTEPHVASSDPTNLQTTLTKQKRKNNSREDEYVLSGRKWWSTGAMDPRCRVALVVVGNVVDESDEDEDEGGKQRHEPEPNHREHHSSHTFVVLELPDPQVVVVRPLTVMGYDDAPFGHAEVVLDNVRVTSGDIVGGIGNGFRIAQARLGPGRIHHCMRAVGMAARCYELMLQRTLERKTFGKYLWEHGSCQEAIAESAADLRAARLLTLDCASAMDAVGAKRARDRIAAIKVLVPRLTYRVVDRAVQVFGGAGVSDDYVMAQFLVALRTLRIADGPDAVHQRTVARIEIQKAKTRSKNEEQTSPLQARSKL